MSFRYQMSVKQNLRMCLWSMVNSPGLCVLLSPRSLSTGWSERPFPTSGAKRIRSESRLL